MLVVSDMCAGAFFMDFLFLDQKKSYLYCHTFVSLSLHVGVTIVTR